METTHHKEFHAAKFSRPDRVNAPLYCITPIINTQRFRSRWKIYKNAFEHQIINAGAHLILIECSYGEREEVYVETVHERHTIINVRTHHELWHKENLINRAIQELHRIDPNWKYVCYVDSDIQFARPDWVGETLHKLQHHPIVQMFSQVAYLSPDNEQLRVALSFMEGWRQGIPFQNKAGIAQDKGAWVKHKHPKDCPCCPPPPYPEHNHSHKIAWAGAPGAAWAYRREALNQLGGLVDYAILGSADYHMSTALMGFLHISLQKGYHPEYVQWLMDWQTRALKYIKRDVGLVKGLILHHWHGKMKDRNYGTRWQILINHQFNPRTDIKKDTNGLWQLEDENDKWQLRDDIRGYFNVRNEDSIDL
ncbi:MAG TPA: hypothetical protein PLS56_01395 [Candidatus Dojkabacteria bacterium]|nr:hypothetical protein [Candidatus Dojkabacteria bacterium]